MNTIETGNSEIDLADPNHYADILNGLPVQMNFPHVKGEVLKASGRTRWTTHKPKTAAEQSVIDELRRHIGDVMPYEVLFQVELLRVGYKLKKQQKIMITAEQLLATRKDFASRGRTQGEELERDKQNKEAARTTTEKPPEINHAPTLDEKCLQWIPPALFELHNEISSLKRLHLIHCAIEDLLRLCADCENDIKTAIKHLNFNE